jgi:ubiquinone/menaquinone biosynthesis C-methylase UbiE
MPQESSVLDVGCGTGEFERIILSEHPEQRMIGVDVSDQMLAIARQKCSAYPNVQFLSGSASVLPFSNDRFDLVISASALHYFDKPDASLAEMRRVVKPSGAVVILDWCKDYPTCRFFDAFCRMTEPAYRRCYTQTEFHRMLASAGFEIRESQKARLDPVWGVMVATACPNRHAAIDSS